MRHRQVNAIVAAMRQVELLIIEDHLNAGMDFAVKSKDIDSAVRDMMVVLRVLCGDSAARRPYRMHRPGTSGQEAAQPRQV